VFEREREPGGGERVGILGGTFDPVHYGHLAIAEEVYCALQLTRMVFVPAGLPPHKPAAGITPVQQRVTMLECAIATNPHFTLSLVDVQRAGPSYTVETLRLLRQEWGPCAELFFVIGSDSLKDLPSWYDPEGILAQATIVALTRPGYVDVRAGLLERLPALKDRLILLEGPLLAISATDLRQRVAEGRPIKYQTPEVVEEYILRHGLYRQAGRGAERQEDTHAAHAI